MRWNEKQNPRIKIVPPRHKKQDARDAAEAENSQAVTKSMTPNAKKPKGASQEMGHIYL